MSYYLGIDIGGTKINAVLMNSLGQKNPRCFSIPTPHNKKTFLKIFGDFVRVIIENKKIKGIGVGVPGIVERKKGVLVKAPNLPFLNNWNVEKFFSAGGGSAFGKKKFTRQIRVDNDSRCFLRAEARLGAGQGYKNIVGLTVGTGIGGAIQIDGEMYYGKNSGAGEFGHTIIEKNKTFEQLGAKKAFLKYGNRSEAIGIGVANIINALAPDVVILGGGGITSGAIKISTIEKTVRRFVMSPLGKKTLIKKSKLGDRAQAIGAALLLGG